VTFLTAKILDIIQIPVLVVTVATLFVVLWIGEGPSTDQRLGTRVLLAGILYNKNTIVMQHIDSIITEKLKGKEHNHGAWEGELVLVVGQVKEVVN